MRVQGGEVGRISGAKSKTGRAATDKSVHLKTSTDAEDKPRRQRKPEQYTPERGGVARPSFTVGSFGRLLQDTGPEHEAAHLDSGARVHRVDLTQLQEN